MIFQKVDMNQWKRREQYQFYSQFSEPFFGLMFNIDISNLYLKCKDEDRSFYLASLHQILTALNKIEEFRFRIMNDDVVVYNSIGVSATVARANETFGFSYIDYDDDYIKFATQAKVEIERVKNNTDFSPAANKVDTIHFSAIPWVQFTGLSHARQFAYPDSVPKVSTGKIYEQEGRYLMPLSIHVHHGLMDGLHVGKFIEKLQSQLLTI